MQKEADDQPIQTGRQNHPVLNERTKELFHGNLCWDKFSIQIVRYNMEGG